MAGRLLTVLLVAAVASSAGWANLRLERSMQSVEQVDSLLFLPNGNYLKVASLGQAPLLADLIYVWAIQYYSEYGREDRFRYVRHIFGDVIAQLDPLYVDAYWMGALILIVEGKDLDGGLELLDLGIESNPDSWLLPYLAGWECYHADRFGAAEAYFSRAEKVPGVPTYVRRTRIGMAAAKGDLRRAYEMWLQVLQDPTADAGAIDIAERQLRHLKIKIDLKEIDSWIGRFQNDNARWPRSLSELVIRGYIDALPIDPLGRRYAYNPETGEVRSEDDRVLAEGV